MSASVPAASPAGLPLQPTECDCLFKLLLVGDSGAGKSNILLQFCDDVYKADSEPTIGVDFRMSSRVIDGTRVNMQLWDTAGQERFRTITASFYRGSHGIVVVYDISSRGSFEHIRMWMEEIAKYAKEGTVCMLVGNKCDLTSERCVSQDEGRELAEDLGVRFMETSARNAHNIDSAFDALCRSIKDAQQPPTEAKGSGIKLSAALHRPGPGGFAGGAGCCGQ